VEQVQQQVCVDPDRIYATGMSNGGHMSHRLACEAADVFAAVAPVAGSMTVTGNCTPAEPISVLHFHGTSDSIVPYDGYPLVMPGAQETMKGWAARSGCDPTSQVVLEKDDVS